MHNVTIYETLSLMGHCFWLCETVSQETLCDMWQQSQYFFEGLWCKSCTTRCVGLCVVFMRAVCVFVYVCLWLWKMSSMELDSCLFLFLPFNIFLHFITLICFSIIFFALVLTFTIPFYVSYFFLVQKVKYFVCFSSLSGSVHPLRHCFVDWITLILQVNCDLLNCFICTFV